MKRRLCVVLPSHWAAVNGGAELQARYLVDALLATGRYAVTYVARNAPKGGSVPGYEVVRVGRGGGRGGLVADAPSLYRALASIRPEIIYQRVGGAYTGICAAYAGRSGCRMVWHIASDADVVPQPVDLSTAGLRQGVERYLLRFGIRRAAAIVAQTQSQAEMLKRHHGRSPDAVVPNFHPSPASRSKKNGQFTVAWVANFKPVKRPEVFVRLAERLGSYRIRFVMAGRIGSDLRTRRLIDRVSRLSQLEYVGELTQGAAERLLASSHLLVNTSQYEGFPNTFVQAWMRRTAVVSLTVDPDGVLVKRGLGVLAGSEDGLCQAVAGFLEQPRRLERLTEKARRYALAVHGLDNAQGVIDILDGTAESNRAHDRPVVVGPMS